MISIIIPVYNVEKYLDQCLESVINLSYADFECILINDGSTDNSGNICNNWAKKDSRFRVIHQENLGVSSARNKGIDNAKGEYIYFLDGDDTCCNDIFSNIFSNISTYDLYLGEYSFVNNYTTYTKEHTENIDNENYALSFLKEDIKACIGSFYVKKNILIENHIKFSSQFKYGEDLEFILKIILCSKTILVENKFYVKYIQHSNSAMQKITLDRYDVFFSRIQLIEFAKLQHNFQVAEYLYEYSSIESIVDVSNRLLRNNFSCKKLKSFFIQNPIIIETLARNTQKKYRYSSILLRKCIYLYSITISIKSYIYKLCYCLGNLKTHINKWFSI